MMREATTLSPAAHARAARHAGVLRTILHPGITLAIWTRPPPPRLLDATEGLAARAPFCRVAEERPDRLGAALVADLPPDPCARTRLATDIARLARLFAALLGTTAVRGRLEAIDSPACRLFHADHVGLRLLCTYAGAGTEWVPDAAVDRARFGDNRAALRDPAAVRRLPRFAVAILKGHAWPGNAGRGVVHRSPDASPDRPRLLLCLDEPGRF
ncbi:DUF1826 domain-containing protein [Elioraea thermophila]|uniref:DUF1826 domain-containing protein n=1 Tax=Elioraea thermophila TaxID=2185104 RepID=UPI000DF3ACCE|nr:DUF1826 domain-containing protein [Elioraea thermophila]